MKQKNTVHRKLHIMTVLFLIMINIYGDLFPHRKKEIPQVTLTKGKGDMQRTFLLNNFSPLSHEICHNNVGSFHLTTWYCQQLVHPLQALASTL